MVDTNIRHNFPNTHRLNATGTKLLGDADVLLLLDVKDIGQHTRLLTKEIRGDRLPALEGPRVLDVGFGDLEISAWSAGYGGLFQPDRSVLADTSPALPQLLVRAARSWRVPRSAVPTTGDRRCGQAAALGPDRRRARCGPPSRRETAEQHLDG